jgi:glycosyltransferase involved in cell wall biosynthesis
MEVMADLGFDVTTVAGEGDDVDHVVDGLAIEADPTDPDDLATRLDEALAGVDLVVVENLLTIPLNLVASRAAARVLAGRPAVVHHHDPPWHRERFAHITELPATDPAWRHVTITRTAHDEMVAHGIKSTVIYNAFERRGDGDRVERRTRLGVASGELLLAHPVRAIERKNVPGAVAVAEQLGATYWLLGPAEEGYGPELDRILAVARCRVLWEPCEVEADLYAAADGVLFPSTWEGFGNPPVEAALYERPCMIGSYPFATELRELGFRFPGPDDAAGLLDAIRRPDGATLGRNRQLAERHFGLDGLRRSLRRLLHEAGWLP